MLPAASREAAVYDDVSTPDVIWSGPVTVTVAMAPGMTVTVWPPDLVGTLFDVAVMVTVPDNAPVSLSTLRLAEPVLLALVQV